MNENFLKEKLSKRKEENLLRQLPLHVDDSYIDFSSNDYLSLAKQDEKATVKNYLLKQIMGSTGSRLISGNHSVFLELETLLANYHGSQDSLIYSSGYSANVGLLSCVAGRHDTIIYDEYIHASLRDGIQLSKAKNFSFKHNVVSDLEQKIGVAKGKIFVVTESIFSMDGDEAPLKDMIECCQKKNAYLITDEAHSVGWQGCRGEGLTKCLGVEHEVFARVVTFGKAIGMHGAAVLGSKTLKDFLINFSRPFIYTTALPPKDIVQIINNYNILPILNIERRHLSMLIQTFKNEDFGFELIKSDSPIQGLMIKDNCLARSLSQFLLEKKIYCLPILSPTVNKGLERIRVILHSYNSEDDIKLLAKYCRQWRLEVFKQI